MGVNFISATLLNLFTSSRCFLVEFFEFSRYKSYLAFAGKWTALEKIMLSDASQFKKKKKNMPNVLSDIKRLAHNGVGRGSMREIDGF